MSNDNLQATDQATEEQQWTDPAVPEQFTVHDDDSANWVIRRIVECRAYARRCSEWCEREQARAKHDEQFFMWRYGPQLMEYTRSRLAEQKNRRKSVGLPAGVIGFRQEAARLVVDDEQAVLAWAREHYPQLIVTIEKVSKSALDEHVEQTGELPDAGVHIQPERDAFYVR